MGATRWIIRSAHDPRLVCAPETGLWWPWSPDFRVSRLTTSEAVRIALPCGGLWSRHGDLDRAPQVALLSGEGVAPVFLDIGPWARRQPGVIPGGVPLPPEETSACLSGLLAAANPTLVGLHRRELLVPERLVLHVRSGPAPVVASAATEEDEAETPAP